MPKARRPRLDREEKSPLRGRMRPGPGRVEPADRPESMLDPDAIAANYLHVLRQPRSAWSSEIELRPWVEPF